MPSGYFPIFIFLVIAILFPVVLIVAAKLIRPSAPFRTKLEAYECGIQPLPIARALHSAVFHHCHPVCNLRRRDHFLFPGGRYRTLGGLGWRRWRYSWPS